VTYRSGELSVDVIATVGKTVWRIDGEFGAQTRVETRDYLISAADLVLDGEQAEPAAGDRIEELLPDGTTAAYEVMSPDAAEPPWRWSDPYHGTLRIHTKQVSVT
jgi:hypothetical protein